MTEQTATGRRSDAEPELAIVVPVHNAAATLPALLDALGALDPRAAEIVFVDDASTDRSAALIAARGHRVVTRAVRGGAAAARNLGVAASDAARILFLDADTAPPTDALERVQRGLATPGVVALVGVYRRRPLNQGFWPRYKALQAEFYHRFHPVTEISWLWGAMAAVRRDAFERAGGFDERYRGADLEDVELGRRLAAFGRILLDRGFVVGHHFAPTLSANVRNHFQRGRHWMRLYGSGSGFDNYLTTRKMALSRLAGAALPAALLAALALGGWLPWLLTLGALAAYAAPSWGLLVLGWRAGGAAFTLAILAAELLLSWVLIGAGASVALEALSGFAGAARGRSDSDCRSR